MAMLRKYINYTVSLQYPPHMNINIKFAVWFIGESKTLSEITLIKSIEQHIKIDKNQQSKHSATTVFTNEEHTE